MSAAAAQAEWRPLTTEVHPDPERPYAIVRFDPTASRLLGQWRWDVYLGGWLVWHWSSATHRAGLFAGRARDEATAHQQASQRLAALIAFRERDRAQRAAAKPTAVPRWTQP